MFIASHRYCTFHYSKIRSFESRMWWSSRVSGLWLFRHVRVIVVIVTDGYFENLWESAFFYFQWLPSYQFISCNAWFLIIIIVIILCLSQFPPMKTSLPMWKNLLRSCSARQSIPSWQAMLGDITIPRPLRVWGEMDWGTWHERCWVGIVKLLAGMRNMSWWTKVTS